jgi:hypothetical protein
VMSATHWISERMSASRMFMTSLSSAVKPPGYTCDTSSRAAVATVARGRGNGSGYGNFHERDRLRSSSSRSDVRALSSGDALAGSVSPCGSARSRTRLCFSTDARFGGGSPRRARVRRARENQCFKPATARARDRQT